MFQKTFLNYRKILRVYCFQDTRLKVPALYANKLYILYDLKKGEIILRICIEQTFVLITLIVLTSLKLYNN